MAFKLPTPFWSMSQWWGQNYRRHFCGCRNDFDLNLLHWFTHLITNVASRIFLQTPFLEPMCDIDEFYGSPFCKLGTYLRISSKWPHFEEWHNQNLFCHFMNCVAADLWSIGNADITNMILSIQLLLFVDLQGVPTRDHKTAPFCNFTNTISDIIFNLCWYLRNCLSVFTRASRRLPDFGKQVGPVPLIHLLFEHLQLGHKSLLFVFEICEIRFGRVFHDVDFLLNLHQIFFQSFWVYKIRQFDEFER